MATEQKNIMIIKGHQNEHDNHVFTRFRRSKNVNAVILQKPLDGASDHDQVMVVITNEITCGLTADNTTDIL